ncbi:unnamed protein product [Spirodela intermedia]|uniref:Uncharacterized protein n=1 Tax=Spirodela intermedia TaxID=51605 RepID=A0A7I8K8K9_SPIIN|nr:unnamed protein product [Spirodela intermedia]
MSKKDELVDVVTKGLSNDDDDEEEEEKEED